MAQHFTVKARLGKHPWKMFYCVSLFVIECEWWMLAVMLFVLICSMFLSYFGLSDTYFLIPFVPVFPHTLCCPSPGPQEPGNRWSSSQATRTVEIPFLVAEFLYRLSVEVWYVPMMWLIDMYAAHRLNMCNIHISHLLWCGKFHIPSGQFCSLSDAPKVFLIRSHGSSAMQDKTYFIFFTALVIWI